MWKHVCREKGDEWICVNREIQIEKGRITICEYK